MNYKYGITTMAALLLTALASPAFSQSWGVQQGSWGTQTGGWGVEKQAPVAAQKGTWQAPPSGSWNVKSASWDVMKQKWEAIKDKWKKMSDDWNKEACSEATIPKAMQETCDALRPQMSMEPPIKMPDYKGLRDSILEHENHMSYPVLPPPEPIGIMERWGGTPASMWTHGPLQTTTPPPPEPIGIRDR
jgi:hypothetical protein